MTPPHPPGAHTPLVLTILRHQPHGAPQRNLELSCHITHAAPYPLCLLDSWIQIEGSNGLRIAEGRLLYTLHSQIEGALLWPNRQTLATLAIPLSPAVLQAVEDQRAGTDFTMRISSRVRICKSVARVHELETLGVPFETFLCSHQHQDHVEYKIPQSDWIKVLRGLSWSELDLIEIPTRARSHASQLTRAFKRLDDALDYYRRGDSEEAMSSCRKAFEALIKDTTGTDNLSQAQAAFAALIADAEKARLLNELVKTFTPFLHLARHEQASPIKIEPKDAMLALHITASVLSYLGK